MAYTTLQHMQVMIIPAHMPRPHLSICLFSRFNYGNRRLAWRWVRFHAVNGLGRMLQRRLTSPLKKNLYNCWLAVFSYVCCISIRVGIFLNIKTYSTSLFPCWWTTNANWTNVFQTEIGICITMLFCSWICLSYMYFFKWFLKYRYTSKAIQQRTVSWM